MYEWNEMVQLMVDWIDGDIATVPSLLKMSEQLGYSPYYCTKQFHSLTGMTLRDYIWLRRISRAALELRDTDARILDIAVKFGFTSQEAFTRAFVKASRNILIITLPGFYLSIVEVTKARNSILKNFC